MEYYGSNITAPKEFCGYVRGAFILMQRDKWPKDFKQVEHVFQFDSCGF